MKLKITQRGVFDAKGKEIEVGTVIDAKGDDVPRALINKCEVVAGDAKGRKAVTNPQGAEPQDAEGDDTPEGGA